MLITVTTGSTSLVSLLNTGGHDITRYNAAPRNILIQNTHATETVYLELDGIAATTAGGIQILAGDSFAYEGAIIGTTNLIAGAANNATRIAINQ